ncbi:hypothetical protein TNCV_3695241 [Trichonephila clavipes]|nr:hypothetical protein TNCV_3695241 [Trichonephila clavipes]
MILSVTYQFSENRLKSQRARSGTKEDMAKISCFRFRKKGDNWDGVQERFHLKAPMLVSSPFVSSFRSNHANDAERLHRVFVHSTSFRVKF